MDLRLDKTSANWVVEDWVSDKVESAMGLSRSDKDGFFPAREEEAEELEDAMADLRRESGRWCELKKAVFVGSVKWTSNAVEDRGAAIATW